ncbi:YjcZ family sporulation protein [Virgibacillus flavescens]
MGYEEGGRGLNFALLVVLFILLVIIGTAYTGGGYGY